MPIPSPAKAHSGEPNLFASRGRVYLSWIEATPGEGGALRFATLEGRGWSKARTVVEDRSMFINWADYPSIVVLEDGQLVAHWLRKSGADPYAYDVKISRSLDGGATWEAPITPHLDGTSTEHGFVSLVPEPNGGVTAVWLDGRKFAAADAAGRLPSNPEMTLRSITFDAAGVAGEEELLDPRICDCCQTSAASLGGGLLVAYRDRSPDEVRDIWAVVRGPEGWADPVRVAADGWQIPGCPVNGPAVVGRDGLGAIAWFSLRAGVPTVSVVFTADGGKSFDEPIVVVAGDTGADVPLGRVDTAWLSAESVVVTWLAVVDTEAEIRLRTAHRDGVLGPTLGVTTTDPGRSSGFPQMVRSGDELVFAWTDPAEASIVRTAIAPLPAAADRSRSTTSAAASGYRIRPAALRPTAVGLPVRLMPRRQADQDSAVDQRSASWLFEAIQNDDLETLDRLLAVGVSPDTQVPAASSSAAAGYSALAWAVQTRHPDIARTLLKAGADIDAPSIEGRSALIFAADRDDGEMV